jgi:homoserine kinase
MIDSGFDVLSKAIKGTEYATVKEAIDSKLLAAAKKAEDAQNIKSAAITETTEEKKQVSKKATILTNIAEWISKGPIGWGVAAAIAAAIGALIVGVGIATSNIKAQEEQEDENFEKDMEELRTTQEKIDKNGELVASY